KLAGTLARNGVDLTVFDLERIQAASTFIEPALTSVGHRHVIVGGVPIIQDAERVPGVLPGRPIRRSV
ncbi:MAG: D-aminoacylase, partial [Planctomycetota bacterium]|nr:D-aminoacylase [Planctomycetota bacterium]